MQEYETILGLLKESFQTMVIVAQCLGLRASEIGALQWQDFDFERQQLLVQRSIVNGQVDDVKTEYSRDHVPLDAALVEVLLAWSKEATPTEEGWVFASPLTNKPYQTTEIQKRHIRPGGMLPCGVSEVWCGSRRLVQPGETDPKRQTATHPPREAGRCREVRSSRLAHVPPHVSFVVGRDRSADEGAAGTHASCLDPDDDERLWTSHDIIQAGSKQQGRGDGTQADESERLKPRFCEWESVGVNPEERPIKIKS